MTTALNQANLTRLATAAKIVKRLKKNPMNPADWQALGRALGWPEKILVCPGCWRLYTHAFYMKGWKFYAHRCFDWIMEGKDPDLFFKELLK